MKKYCIIIFIVLTACKGNPENEFSSVIRKHLEDDAFKQNEKIKLYDLNVLKIDTLTELSVDSEYLSRINEHLDYYISRSKENLAIIHSTLELSSLYIQSGQNALSRHYLDDAKEYRNKVKVFQDSTAYYLKLDSTIRARIPKNKFPQTVYRIKTFLKATQYTKKDSLNVLDTLFYFFDKQKKIIDLRILPR